MNAKIIKDDGRVKLSVNGEILEPVAFMTYNPDAGQFGKIFNSGIRIACFGAYACDQGINSLACLRPFTPHFFVGPQSYDFREIARTLELIAPGGKGAYIIPRVYLTVPKWWELKNPSELARDYRGEAAREAYSSEKWREDMWGALKAFIDFVNGSIWCECIIGYHIAAGGTEEWTYHGHRIDDGLYDYSEVSVAAFRRWLSNMYTDISTLNIAWGKDYQSFDSIEIPDAAQRKLCYNGILLDPHRERDVLDYCEYESCLFVDAITYFCRCVKEYSNNTLLTGAFYGYVTMLSRIDKSHFKLGLLLESPYIDFVATTNGDGGPGGSWSFGSAVDSVRLHDKLFIAEGDVRTCLTRTPGENMPHIVPDNDYYSRKDVWKGPATMALSETALKKAAARVLCGKTGIWWFDMFGGAFDAPELMNVISALPRLAARQTEGPLEAEVAVIIDEEGLRYFRRNADVLRRIVDGQRVLLGRLGVPYHIYLADDLADARFPAQQYKLYLMLMFIEPSQEVSEAIEQKLKTRHTTILWTYFAGLRRPELTDYALTYDPAQPDMRCRYSTERFASYEKPYAKLAPEKCESPVYPSEPVPCPRFSPETLKDAYTVACFENTTEPCLAWKRFETYSSVYSLLPELPSAVLHEVCIMSGVHLYSVTDDIIYAGGRFAALLSRTAGYKRIHFPCPVSRVVDAETGEVMTIHDKVVIDFWMEQYELRMFEVDESSEDRGDA